MNTEFRKVLQMVVASTTASKSPESILWPFFEQLNLMASSDSVVYLNSALEVYISSYMYTSFSNNSRLASISVVNFIDHFLDSSNI